MKFIQDEVESLTKSIQATEFVLGQWKRNAENGAWPAETMPSIATLQQNMESMRRGLSHIERILTDSDD